MIDDPEQSPAPVRQTPDLDHPAPATTRVARVWFAALAAGVLAAALAWPAVEAAVRSIPTETEGVNVNGEEKAIVTVLSSYRSDVKRATLAYGLQGAILGLALGLAGAAVRRSAGAAPVAALAGLIGGGIAGAGVSFGLFPIFFRHLDPISGDLLLPLITHGAVWSAVGAAVGLAFGIGRGGGPGPIARAALGGLIAAALGAVACQLFGAFIFPQAKTDMPVAADPSARLVAIVLICLSIAAGAASIDRSARRRSGRPRDGLVEDREPLTA
jgi:hypothetical protein